jgi:basic membrane protein A
MAQPAVIYELGGKFDKSFNQAAWEGAERWKARRPARPTSSSRSECGAARAGCGASPSAAPTRWWASASRRPAAIDKVAAAFPNLRFAIVDMVVPLPNVQSFVYREHEGSFLVGMLAAHGQQDRQGRLRRRAGHPAGAQVPVRLRTGRPVRRAQGRGGLGDDRHHPAAWTDPARGAELAKAQIAQGVDVVFAAAGTTGLGIMQAAKDAGKLAIGVDSNQNHLHPGNILTSMVKRVDLAVWQAFKGVQPGITALGLKEGAIDYAMDEHNARLVPPEMKQKVEAAKAAIIAGKIQVIDYTAANACR